MMPGANELLPLPAGACCCIRRRALAGDGTGAGAAPLAAVAVPPTDSKVCREVAEELSCIKRCAKQLCLMGVLQACT